MCCLWLVENDHVTWILNSDWTRQITWPVTPRLKPHPGRVLTLTRNLLLALTHTRVQSVCASGFYNKSTKIYRKICLDVRWLCCEKQWNSKITGIMNKLFFHKQLSACQLIFLLCTNNKQKNLFPVVCWVFSCGWVVIMTELSQISTSYIDDTTHPHLHNNKTSFSIHH